MPITKKILACTLGILLIVTDLCFAQTKASKQTLGNAKNDSIQRTLLLNRARSAKDKKESLAYFNAALEYENDTHRRAEILDTIGLFNWQLGNFQEAINYFNQSLDLFSQLKDSLWLGKVHNNIAVVSWGMGNTIEALSHYQKALLFRKAMNDRAGITKVMNNIGLIYQEWGLYDKAFELHSEALEVATEIQDLASITYSYSNLGNCYEYKDEYRKALDSYRRAINIFSKEDSISRHNSFISVNIASVYNQMGKLDSALYHYHKAVEYGQRMDNRYRIAIANHHLGNIHFKLNHVDSAKYYTYKSMDLAKEKNYTGLIRDNLFVLSEIAEQEGRTTSALNYYKRASALKDSLFNSEKINKFNDLQIKYFTEQQETENKILRANNEIQKITINQQQRTARILIITGLIILIVLFVVARSRILLKRLSVRLEKSETELRKANADKDKFFTILAHDLKSPFSGLLGTTDLLASNFDDLPPESIKELLFAMKDSSTNVYALLEGLLQWSQVQTGTMSYQFEKIDILKIGTNVCKLLTTNAQHKDIELRLKIQPNTFAFADEKTISSVFRNLISNAIKYTNPQGHITVEAITKQGLIEISVTDNGIGMDKKTCSRLFDITQMISQQGTQNEQGTGLGLILTKEFIQKNKGQIHVESELGKGSRFTFTLPAFNQESLK